MKATQVSIGPSEASLAGGRATLVPEMLAAVGARYSRSNLGLEAILEKVAGQDQEQSIDAIFRFIDYGHASVADMAPVAIFMDGISMWLAYHLWALCPTAGGQESSTRYIRLSSDNLPDPNDLGIPLESQSEWRQAMDDALGAYQKALDFWEDYAVKHPDATRIPASLLNDESDKAQKIVARMKRNYAFDRARYFLPAALQTNVMMVQSARAWVALCQQLLSHPLPEPRKLGGLIREELSLVAPRLIKHAAAQETFQLASERSFSRMFDRAMALGEDWAWLLGEDDDEPFLEVWTKQEKEFAADLEFHTNRYAFIGETLQNTPVQFGWSGIAFGDLRDLNRHRTGSKFCDLVPSGFYCAEDQAKTNLPPSVVETGQEVTSRSLHVLGKDRKAFGIYWLLLGAQLKFTHTTTADKFIYEAELRTGVGAHYRYAKHLHDALELWYKRFPATRGLILEGSAEPE
jgi:thymidylate synthase ThyX